MILASQELLDLAALLDNRDSQVILALWVIWVPLAEQVSRVIQGQRGQRA